jgi:hypothetical protein
MIIDESDGEVSTARRALEMGYVGASHKNCKGIFKGLGNACLIEHRRRTNPGGTYLLSGEDLSNVGPVSLQQDVCAAASFGVNHIERNGHHYFRGLGMFPADVQEAILAAHPDLYRRHDQGFATVRIERGRMQIGSVLDAPFGAAARVDPTQFTPLAEWSAESLPS